MLSFGISSVWPIMEVEKFNISPLFNAGVSVGEFKFNTILISLLSKGNRFAKFQFKLPVDWFEILGLLETKSKTLSSNVKLTEPVWVVVPLFL